MAAGSSPESLQTIFAMEPTNSKAGSAGKDWLMMPKHSCMPINIYNFCHIYIFYFYA